MIKKVVLFVLCLYFQQALFSQKGFRIGPSISLVSSRSYVLDSLPDNFNFRFKSGFNAAISLQYGFTDRFTLGTGIGYTNKGYRVFNDSNDNGNLLKHNFGNLEIPVNAIFKMRIGATSKMRALAGLTLNYQIGSTEKVLKNNNNTFVISEKSINTLYPMLNLGVEIGSEGKSGNMFVFGVYYKQSFTQMSELSIYNSSDLSQQRLFALGYRGSYVGIGISYLFDMKNFKREEEYFY